MLENTGIVPQEMVEKILPSGGEKSKRAFAIFECFQEIPVTHVLQDVR